MERRNEEQANSEKTDRVSAGLGVKGDRAEMDWPAKCGANPVGMTPVPLYLQESKLQD